MKKNSAITIAGQVGVCGHLPVFLGFAAARTLHSLSFADILNEDTGEGYQRPRNMAHSRSFRQYISQPHTSTITLTFNLRRELSRYWSITKSRTGHATLRVAAGHRCLAQVDCQHRLGELHDLDVPLAFMAFVNLPLRDEMALFNVINSKAKGLSSSLTDYHESNLLTDLAAAAPHLLIARRLNEDPRSPWYRLIRYGGETTSGLRRRTSLRMMQRSVHRFLCQTKDIPLGDVDAKYVLVRDYWAAVKNTFPAEWAAPRSSLITKGVGLYALTFLLSDIVKAAGRNGDATGCFAARLKRLVGQVDWGTHGPLARAGGQKGAAEVYHELRKMAEL